MKLAALLLLALTASADDGFRARVTEVYNGETLTIRDVVTRSEEVVRLEGVIAPGRWRPFAARSRESLRELVKHKQVTVIPRTRDARGRLVATVLIDGLDVGREQIRRGMAWYDSEEAPFAPYGEAQAEAEREARGVWSRQQRR